MLAYVFPKKVALLITAKQNIFFKGFSAKQQKKPKKAANYSVIEQNALSDNYMENIMKQPVERKAKRGWKEGDMIRK